MSGVLDNAGTAGRGIGLALAAYTCWVLADASLKAAGASPLPGFEVLALIGAAEVLLLFLLGAMQGTLARLQPRNMRLQVMRSGLDLANNLCVVVALRHLPLALFYILVFLAPSVTALLGIIILRERPTWVTAAGISVGFVGVLVAVDPLHRIAPGSWKGYAACMVCVAAFSANMIWSRRLTQTETPESMTLSSAALMVVLGGGASLVRGQLPSRPLLLIALLAGVFCMVGSLCFFAALRRAPAAYISQFHYTQLLSGALVAWLVWRERPTFPMLIGAVLIVAAALLPAWKARYAAKESKLRSPEPSGSLHGT